MGGSGTGDCTCCLHAFATIVYALKAAAEAVDPLALRQTSTQNLTARRSASQKACDIRSGTGY